MKGKEGGNDNQGFGIHHEYILCFARNAELAARKILLDEKDVSRHIVVLPEANQVVQGEEIYKDGEPFQLINLSKQKDYKVGRQSNGIPIVLRKPSMNTSGLENCLLVKRESLT